MSHHRPDDTSPADAETNTDAPHGATLFHDGACPLCAWEVSHYRNQDRDGRISFVDVASETSQTHSALGDAGLSRDTALSRLHVRLADGRVVSGARAFVAIWAQLPGWRRFAPIAGAPPIIWILEAGYRLFLPLRPLLARWLGPQLTPAPPRERAARPTSDTSS